MGEPAQARTELNDLVKNNPEVWDAKLQLAAIDLNDKNYRAAEETFEKRCIRIPTIRRGAS